MLLAILVVVPVAFWWRFASSSYFLTDDFTHFYWAHTSDAGCWSYAFAPAFGHLAPGYRLTYLALDRLAPMNFEVALAFLVACQAVSAVLLQRILTLLFGRAWWTYALALAWAISAVYLPAFAWFAAGLHSITAITATLASIHGYLCWRATGRRAWLAWSLVAMAHRAGLLREGAADPALPGPDAGAAARPRGAAARLAAIAPRRVAGVARLRGGVRRLPARVLARRLLRAPESGATVGEVLHYLRVFWFEGFSPMVFGVRVPQYGQEDWHAIAIVAAQAGADRPRRLERRAPPRRVAGVGFPARGGGGQRADGRRTGRRS